MDVTLFLNHACNLGCTYCYNGRKFHRPMPREILLRGVELAFEGERARVSFFGGEPLLELGLIRAAVAHARETEARRGGEIPVRFAMTTNGTLLTPKTVDFLRAERFHLVVSLDGCRAAHDRTRPRADGASSHADVVDGFLRARDAIPSVETITVIDPATVDLVPESFEFLVGLGARNINFTYNYEAPWRDDDLERLRGALSALGALYAETFRRGDDVALDLFDSKIITHLKGGYAPRDRCRFGEGELCVAPSGRLYPCERLVGDDTREELAIGDVFCGPILERVIAMCRRKNRPDPDCATCELAHRCMYWCGCVNFATTGDVGRTSGLLCALEQLTIAAADEIAGALFAGRVPAFIGRFYRPR